MQRSHRRWAVILIVVGLGVSACTHKSEMPAQSKPAKTEVVQGTDLSRVTLSPKAAERLDIKTAAMRDEQVRSEERRVGKECRYRRSPYADSKNTDVKRSRVGTIAR